MNERFMEYLESAIDKAEQAVDSISYSSYPEVNKEVIAKIEKAIAIMEEALDMEISKP
jgi:molybdopterin synthase catalytic subunit